MLKFKKGLNKQQRSDQASRAARVRWDRYHAEKAGDPIRQDLPDPLYEMTFKNNLTGQYHDIKFHRLNGKSFRVTDNGRFWMNAGFSKVLEAIRKRTPKIQCYQ